MTLRLSGFSCSVARLSHFLARHAIVLSPEQFALIEGVRSALVTGLALVPALYFHNPSYGWIAFAAFWACLLEPGGGIGERARIMLAFTVLGGAGVVLGAVAAWLGPAAVVGVLLLAGVACGLARALPPVQALLFTLVGAAVAAATGFAQPVAGAVRLAGLFVAGAVLATVFCLLIWRLHPYGSARRATSSAFRLLAVMAEELSAGVLREAVHRQAVRAAIEQARSVAVQSNAGHASEGRRRRFGTALTGAERLFSAMLAIEHVIQREGVDPPGRAALAEVGRLCRVESADFLRPEGGSAAVREGAARLVGTVRSTRIAELVVICGQALALVAGMGEVEGAGELVRPRVRLTRSIVLHAMRVALALVGTYGACRMLHLPFTYWALIAALLVIQPSGSTTLIRSFERVLGSVSGAVLAAVLAAGTHDPVVLLVMTMPLTVLAIAMRAVNYTMLVLFLTALFIVVAELLTPGQGAVWARVIDNVLGAVIGLVVSLLVWPERVDRDRDRMLAEAVRATLQYVALALRGVSGPTLDGAQRSAGLATIRAEYAQGGILLLSGGSVGRADGTRQVALRAIRRIGGEATLRRFDIGMGVYGPDLVLAGRIEALVDRLSPGGSLTPGQALEVLEASGIGSAVPEMGKPGEDSALQGDAPV